METPLTPGQVLEKWWSTQNFVVSSVLHLETFLLPLPVHINKKQNKISYMPVKLNSQF